MKKKIILVLIVLALTTLCLFGCATNNSNNTKKKVLSEIGISYNVKYIDPNCVDSPVEKQTYYTIFNDGTGTYDFYESSYGVITSYRINFKYLMLRDEGTLICFYDSEEYYDDHTDSKSESNTQYDDWQQTLIYTKEILMTNQAKLFICEDYFANIPNYKP